MSDMVFANGSRRVTWLSVAGLVALQALVLGWMVWNNESLLRTGQEILLDVEPVDPRSLFRGDYVILRYKDLSRLSPPVISQAMIDKISGGYRLGIGSPIAVILAQDETGDRWRAVRSVDACPKPISRNEVCLKGAVSRLGGVGANRGATIKYGLENYFVSEGEGRKLEKLIQIKRLQVVIAIDGSGQGIIKGLVVDGQRVSNEGLF